jgi:hypothetical protein
MYIRIFLSNTINEKTLIIIGDVVLANILILWSMWLRGIGFPRTLMPNAVIHNTETTCPQQSLLLWTSIAHSMYGDMVYALRKRLESTACRLYRKLKESQNPSVKHEFYLIYLFYSV